MANETAQVWRVFSVADGTTSMEQIEIPLAEARNGFASKLLAGTGVMIRHVRPNITPTWHTAPQRQLIATLFGQCEIETGDGQRLVVTTGVLVLVEDTEGVGHMTWTHPTDGWHCLFLPLAGNTVLV